MALQTKASAATINLAGGFAFEVTGTTTVNTISGVHDGELKWIFPTGALPLSAAGNISAAVTCIANQPFLITSRNSVIYVVNTASGFLGILGVSHGGTGADLSGTGGANQFVKQSSAGGAFTVGALGAGDVPDAALTANVALLDRDPQTFAGATLWTKSFTKYNNITTAGQGVAPIVATAALTGQSGAVATQTLIAANAPAGVYVIHAYIYTTTTGNAETASFQFNYTDDAGARAYGSGETIVINTLGFNEGSHTFYASTGAITYEVSVSGALGTGRYTVRVVLERLV